MDVYPESLRLFEDARIDSNEMQAIVDQMRRVRNDTVQFEQDDVIILEGVKNDHFYVILEGDVEMRKRTHGSEDSMRVDQFGAGDLIGLTSFWTKSPSFLESRAMGPVTCLKLDGNAIKELSQIDSSIRETIEHLFISNLSNRYRRMIALNVQVAELGEALESEHTRLKKAMADLEETRNRLIHQEKLATLGQLLAGIAHEINNPCSALSRGTDLLIESIPKLFQKGQPLADHATEGAMLEEGIRCPYWSPEEKRKRMDQLAEQFPHLKRSVHRRIAQLNMDAVKRLNLPQNSAPTEDQLNRVLSLLEFHEIGMSLRSVRISSERIHSLVISLKNYGKQDQDAWEHFDLREGIRDTLTVLNNRLKHYSVHLQLDPIPTTYCNGGEMNQVWTNLLVNACQATPESGEIGIRTTATKDRLTVTVEDSGPGIAEQNLERIFETNFTTKKSKSDFGLGLGLAISREIIAKHNGQITADNRPHGGARFTVQLPIKK